MLEVLLLAFAIIYGCFFVSIDLGVKQNFDKN